MFLVHMQKTKLVQTGKKKIDSLISILKIIESMLKKTIAYDGRVHYKIYENG